MIKTSNPTGLVARTGLAHRSRTGLPGALAGAINLTTVAVAANQHLGTATRTQEETARSFHRRLSCADKNSTGSRILWNNLPAQVPMHIVGRGTGKDLEVLPGIAPALFGNVIFTRIAVDCHSAQVNLCKPATCPYLRRK
jgi:hypothetical protein